MSEEKNIRLNKVKGDLNVSIDRIFEFLDDKGFKMDRNPNQKISEEVFQLLRKEFAQDMEEKEESKYSRENFEFVGKNRQPISQQLLVEITKLQHP